MIMFEAPLFNKKEQIRYRKWTSYSSYTKQLNPELKLIFSFPLRPLNGYEEDAHNYYIWFMSEGSE